LLSIFYTDDFLNHDTGVNHPESPERLRACVSALKSFREANKINWISPRKVTEEELQWVHTQEYIDRLKSSCARGGGFIDEDTQISQKSYDVALKSAGAWLNSVDEVLKGNSSFALSRPPGHHAESDRAMGFCLFSNAALASIYALNHKGVNRVLVFDWDVHHGNGTQHIVQSYRGIAYVSIHQYPFYPGTGFHDEKGSHGNVLNVPIYAGTTSEGYLYKFDREVFPFIQKFNPDLFIISAGFDAHQRDPLANINLTTDDYVYMTKKCLEIQPNFLLGLEGGYDFKALGECCVEVCRVLLGH